MLLVNSNAVTKIMGGFGNQLFCYACGYAVAKENGRALIIDTSQQDNDPYRNVDILRLNIQYSRRITFRKRKNLLSRAIGNRIKLMKEMGFFPTRIKEKQPYVYQDSVFTNNSQNIYLDGYWQSEKYFKKYRTDLLEMFTPQVPFIKDKCSIENNPCVAIHIRHGDYLAIGCAIDECYYEKAITYIKKMIGENLEFLIFSDDIEYAKRFAQSRHNLKMTVVNSEGDNQTLRDFYRMTSCTHFIIANSSYSWWAAWLGKAPEKIVICPESNMWTGDFYPEEWIKIKAGISNNESGNEKE